MICEVMFYSIPHTSTGINTGTSFNTPVVKFHHLTGSYNALCSKLTCPGLIMGCNEKLTTSKELCKQTTDLPPVWSINGSQNIIQYDDVNVTLCKTLCKCQIKTYPHTILMTFTVKCIGRINSSSMKINLEIQSSTL